MKFEKNFAVAYFKKRKPYWATIDSIALTVVLLLLMMVVNPKDPLFLAGPFPWIIFAPIICALFYGTMNGIVSLVVLLAYMFLKVPYGDDASFAVRAYWVGLSSATLLTGLCSSYWLSRIKHVEHLNVYLREHLESLSRDYYLLRVSHEKIEHSYLTKPISFREAIYQIKQAIQSNLGIVDEKIAKQILIVCSQYSSVSAAAFCSFDEKKNTIYSLAYLGKEFFISITDPLVRHAMTKKTTSYLAINTLDHEETSDYLVVIPLIDDYQARKGFIVIKEMPFWSLTHDNLEVMSVFASIFAMHWTAMNKVDNLIESFPAFSAEFLRELKMLVALKKHHQVDSAISGIFVPNGLSQQNVLYSLDHKKRTLESSVFLSMKGGTLLVFLLPITSKEGILGYKNRITNLLKSDFGLTINDNGFTMRVLEISEQAVDEQLQQFLEEFSYGPR